MSFDTYPQACLTAMRSVRSGDYRTAISAYSWAIDFLLYREMRRISDQSVQYALNARRSLYAALNASKGGAHDRPLPFLQETDNADHG